MEPAPQRQLRLDPGDILLKLRKQRMTIIVFLCTVMLTTLVGSLLVPKQYKATVLLHLLPRAGQEVNVDQVIDFDTRSYFETKEAARTQLQIIQSRTIAEEATRRYLALGYDDVAADDIPRMLWVGPRAQTELIELSITHTDPERAAILANVMAEVYKERNLEVRRDSAREAKEWLAEKLTDHKKQLDQSNVALLDYKASKDLVDIEESINAQNARMRSLSESYGELSTEHVLLQTSVDEHKKQLASHSFQELAREYEDPILKGLSEEYASALTDRARLESRYGQEHPQRRLADENLERITRLIEEEVRQNLAAEEARLNTMTSRLKSVDQEMVTVKALLLEKQTLQAGYEDLKVKADQNREFYNALLKRDNELDLSARTQLNDVRIVDAAQVPKRSVKPNIALNMLIATVLGCLGGVGVALLREYLDDRINSPLDIEVYLKARYLGLVPKVPKTAIKGAQALYTFHNPRSTVAEAIRGLRAMLTLGETGYPRKLLVTSSISQEGKTETVVRLGIAFATLGKRVVLLDADLRRPRLHAIFDLENTAGTVDLLLGTKTIDEVVMPTPVPGLHVVVRGPEAEHPNELLSAPSMEQTLDALCERYDMIIVDTPPSAGISDALTLSKIVDGTLMVVKHGTVPRAVAMQTVERLRMVDAKLLGVCINNVDLEDVNTRYYYSYYGYGTYSYYLDGTGNEAS